MSEAQPSGAKNKRTARLVLTVLTVLLVLLGAAYVAAYFIAGDRVPQKSRVDGVPIGGMSPDEAVEHLRGELLPKYEQPVKISDDDGHVVELAPADSGLRVDLEEAVRATGGGFSWNPLHIWGTFTGGGEVTAPVRVDKKKLSQSLEGVADQFVTEAQDAALAYEGAEVKLTEGTDRQDLNVKETTSAVADAYKARNHDVKAIRTPSAPQVTTELAQAETDAFAKPAVSGDVEIMVGDQSLTVTPEQIAAAVSFTGSPEGFSHTVDGKELLKQTAKQREQIKLGEPQDASYKLADGKVEIVPSTDGVSLEPDALAAAVEEAATKSGGERKATAEVTTVRPEFTTEQAEKIGPKEVVGEFTTYFPHTASGNTNLGRAAELVNGAVVMPGETWSYDAVVGERTEENGFVPGQVINGGKMEMMVGGGISQSATTLFNAAFFAGWEDIEHKPHSLYISRYPVGREATLWYGAFDLKFRNNTEYPGVIEAFIEESKPGEQGSFTVKIYSQKTWEKVTATEAEKSDFTSGVDRHVDGADCIPQQPQEGFTAKYKREFWQDGKVVKTEDFEWIYSPADRIICTAQR